MKLAKKMLACVIALAMVAALALTSFAAATTLSVSAVKSDDGKQVYVTVSATDYAGFKSGSVVIGYDHTALEYVEDEEEGLDKGLTVTAGIPAGMTAEDDIVNVGLMYAKEAKNAEADIFTLTFNVIAEKNSKITVTVGEWDGTEKPVAGAETTVVVVAETTTKAPETTTKAPETTTAAPVTTTETPVVEDASADATTTPVTTPGMGDAGVAAVAGVMALAAVAFVVTRKKDAE